MSESDVEGVSEDECDSCGQMKPVAEGETVIVHTHRVEGWAVGVDREWICADCLYEFEK